MKRSNKYIKAKRANRFHDEHQVLRNMPVPAVKLVHETAVITSLRTIGFHAGVQYFEGVKRDGTPSGLVFGRRINGELHFWSGTTLTHAEVICSAQNSAQSVAGGTW